MEMRTLVFVAVGGLTAFVGGIMLIVAAFRQHLLWGLSVLFLPLASLVYTILHWAEAKKSFFVSLAGGALILLGAATSPTFRTLALQVHRGDLTRLQLPADGFAMQPKEPAPNLDEQILKQRETIALLEAKFAEDGQAIVKEFNALSEQRRLLNSADSAAVDAFNKAVAEYQAHNAARKSAKDELQALRLELDTLQDRRTQERAAAANAPASKKVVIYTTASCPACKMAKSYFAKKGVTYDERDVDSSPEAHAEFLRLGGRGVPLIMVGQERMEGFSQQRLDQLL